MFHRLASVLVLGLLVAWPAFADAGAATKVQQVTLELVMSHPDWIGTEPEDPYWSDDGTAVYYERKREGEELNDLYRLEIDRDNPLQVRDEDRGDIDGEGGDWSPDRRRKVYSHQGDLYVHDLATGQRHQLTRTSAAERSPLFLTDGRVAFLRDRQFFVRDLESGLESQPVDLRLGEDPDDEEDAEDYLSRQQPRLLDVVREDQRNREQRRERTRELQENDPSRAPKAWYLGKGIEIMQRSLSPSGDWLALVVIPEKRDDGRRDQMPSYVSEDGYVEIREVRPKVGTADGASEALWILDLVSREKHVIDLSVLPGIEEDPLADLKRKAKAEEAARKGEELKEEEEAEAKARSVRFEEGLRWSPDGSRLAFQTHSYDNKDRWLGVVARNAPSEVIAVHRLSRPGWINWFYNDYDWFPDNRRLYFLSEESGYSHLYVHDLRDGKTAQLTEGAQVVGSPQPTPDGQWIYFTANPEHPGVYEVFRVESAGGKTEQVSRLGGRNAFTLSPQGTHLLLQHSALLQPPELYVQEARPGATARRLTRTVSEAFESLPWVEPQIVPVPSTHHDRPVYGRYYPPSSTAGVGPEGQRPAVVFVHGAGYLQNAHKGWSGYFREFMFHTFLSQQGYAVLDLDYRGSAGYGADWREAIYRQMGTPELEDLEDGVRWMVEEHGVDPQRVGVYGGSYGGFLTMMSLFKEPDLFAAGAALRPVTDWAHYNHPYTSNILNTPDVDPGAYERSSPIEFAEGLSRPLLICAPMLDDNVFFQDTVRLAQKLIELEKEDWEVAIFPVEPHGFRRPSSWLDEYRRIFRLFETHLQP